MKRATGKQYYYYEASCRFCGGDRGISEKHSGKMMARQNLSQVRDKRRPFDKENSASSNQGVLSPSSCGRGRLKSGWRTSV